MTKYERYQVWCWWKHRGAIREGYVREDPQEDYSVWSSAEEARQYIVDARKYEVEHPDTDWGSSKYRIDRIIEIIEEGEWE